MKMIPAIKLEKEKKAEYIPYLSRDISSLDIQSPLATDIRLPIGKYNPSKDHQEELWQKTCPKI